MKKIINSLLVVAAAAIALTACSKEEQQVRNESGVVTFHAISPATKTTFGTLSGNKYPTIWTANDANIKIAQNFSNGVNAAVTKVSDTEATFDAEIKDDETGSYTFYAVTPASAVVSGVNKTYFSWNLEIPTEQTPSASGPDESAMLMAATSSTTAVFPSEVNLAFKHLTAYGKMSILNLGLSAGDAVSSVQITATNNLAYRYYYYVSGEDEGKLVESSAKNAITIHTSSASDIWFACAPLEMGTELTITVTTTNFKVYTKENIAIPAALAAGHIAVFNVDFVGITPLADKVYRLVTSYDELTPGSEVIVSAVGDDDYAMGILSTSGTYASREVAAKSADDQTITNPASTIDVFTLEAGSSSNTVAFNGTNGYLTSYSNSNNAKASSTKDDNSSFSVVILNETTGAISLQANGTYTAKDLRYNSSSERFSLYSITSGMANPALYKLEGSGSGSSLVTTYTVTYDGNGATGGTVPASFVTTGPFTVAAAGDLEKTGYTFNGWNTAADGSGTAYAAGASATVTADLTLYAQWKVDDETTKTFIVKSSDVVSGSAYSNYTKEIDGRKWLITFGGNNKSVGTNSGNRSKCNLSNYAQYAVSPVTTSSTASVFANTESLSNVKGISYTINGGSNQTYTNVYLLYSSDNSTFTQITLTNGTQGAAISSGTEFEFTKCTGYFAVLFVSTNSSGNWRIDDVDLTFTYE